MSGKTMIRGKVESFSSGNGYIIGNDGIVYFVHHSDIKEACGDTMPSLSPGDVVEFFAQEGNSEEEMVAIDVRIAKVTQDG